MDIQNYTTEHRKGQHLLAEERHEIEVRLKDGWSPYRIAKHLGRAYNTIKNEIARGTVYLYNGKVARYKAKAGEQQYCYSIAYNILTNQEDAEESVSDTYLSAWNSMPPRRPPALAAFLGKITRNISIDRWRKYCAFKRGEGQIEIALEELSECVGGESAEDAAIRKEILASLNRFLGTLKETERSVFLCRYWYLDSTEEIAEKSGFSVSKVKSMLFRIRKRLHTQLVKEGLV